MHTNTKIKDTEIQTRREIQMLRLTHIHMHINTDTGIQTNKDIQIHTYMYIDIPNYSHS